MNGTAFATYIRNKTYTDSTSFTDAQIVTRANIIKDEMASRITEAFGDFFLVPQTSSLVADQREYSLPDDYIKIKQVEALLDGTNWKKLKAFDINNYRRPTNETDILANFSDNNPQYDVFRGSFMIYSGSAITAITDGLKLWCIIYPADLETTDLSGTTDLSVPSIDTEVAMPRNMHRLWADAVVIDWKESQDRPVPQTAGEQMWETRIREQISILKDTNIDEMVGLVGEDPWTQSPLEDGSNYLIFNSIKWQNLKW